MLIRFPDRVISIRQKDNYIQYTGLHLTWVRLSFNTWTWTAFHGAQCVFHLKLSTVSMGQSRPYAECRLTFFFFLPWIHSGQDVPCTLWIPAFRKLHLRHVKCYHCWPQFSATSPRCSLRLESLAVSRDPWIQISGCWTIRHKFGTIWFFMAHLTLPNKVTLNTQLLHFWSRAKFVSSQNTQTLTFSQSWTILTRGE